MKKWIALMISVALILGVSAALAKTVEPGKTEVEGYAGKTLHATVGAYDAESKTFTVFVYDYDRYDRENTENLAVGDRILAGGFLYTIEGIEKIEDSIIYQCAGGEEISFGKSYDSGDDQGKVIARSSFDDRIFMNEVAILHLPAAEGMVYEDDSDPEQENGPVVIEGLDEILKAQKEKIENSIGFDFYATTITLNENLEIVKIHQAYDVAQ